MKIVGVGVNDANYPVTWWDDGVKRVCPFYRRWVGMMHRSYNKKFKERHPTYRNCSIAEEWHSFMKFKQWMVTQDWEGKELDKDLLGKSNKSYGPETCVFISPALNTFLRENLSTRGNLPIGVTLDKRRGTFSAQIKWRGKRKFLGSFKTPKDAHNAWAAAKLELAMEFSREHDDPRVAKALLERYALPITEGDGQ